MGWRVLARCVASLTCEATTHRPECVRANGMLGVAYTHGGYYVGYAARAFTLRAHAQYGVLYIMERGTRPHARSLAMRSRRTHIIYYIYLGICII